MRNAIMAAVTMGLATLCMAGLAQAQSVDIGLQETGVNGGSITTEATGTTGAAFGIPTSITYGDWKVSASASANPSLTAPGVLFSNSIDTLTTKSGVQLEVWVHATGITYPTLAATFTDLFGTEGISGTGTVTEETWINTGVNDYSTSGIALGPVTFSGPHATSQSENVSDLITPDVPLNITQEYILTSAKNLNLNSSNDLSATTAAPEPGTVAVMASGLLVLGMLRRRSR